MKLVLTHQTNRVKNGFAVRSPELGLTAHGHTEQVALLNLRHTIELFLAPFVRDGVLEEQLKQLRVKVVQDGSNDVKIDLGNLTLVG